MNIDPTTTKYLVHCKINAEGVIEKPDVIGAIFGQTEGLLGDELDLRDLQKSGRMGRIEVNVDSKKGRSQGSVIIPSSLDQVETAILAAALETIERVGPCKASFGVEKIEDVRMSKRVLIVERAKELLKGLISSANIAGLDLSDSVRQMVQIDEITSYGNYSNPAGPNVDTSDAIIIVEGRSDVLNLLKFGIKNTIAVEGTNINEEVQKLTRERVVTAFVDGDRGGELIIRELLQVAELDFIARAPPNTEVEELTQKQVMKSLRNKLPVEQYMEMYDIKLEDSSESTPKPQNESRDRKGGRPQRGDRNGGRDSGRDRGPKRDQPKPQRPEPRNAPRPQQRPEPREEPRPAPRYEPRSEPKPEPRQVKTEAPRQEPRYEPRPEPRSRPAPIPSPSAASAIPMTPRIAEIKTKIETLFKDRMGEFVDASGKVITTVPVGELADTLKNTKDQVDSVVFGGFVTQRLVDIASMKGIKTIAGLKESNVTKKPENLEIITKDRL
jgi:DNA primase